MKEQSKKRTLRKATDNDVKYISLRNGTRFAELTASCTDAPKIYPDAPNGYMPDGSKLIEVPELYLTSEDYDRIYRETIGVILDAKEDNSDDGAHQMSVMAVPKPTAYRLTKDDKDKPSSDDKLSDEISNILEQIGDVQAELICRHQFGNSVRPALENVSEEDLCERGIKLFYMLRNKYQGKDAVLREKDK